MEFRQDICLLAGFRQNDVSAIGKMTDPVDMFLNYWMEIDGANCTLGKLMSLLNEIERLDIICEISKLTGYQHESQLPSVSINPIYSTFYW
jgi:hypothetical protein